MEYMRILRAVGGPNETDDDIELKLPKIEHNADSGKSLR